jgi:hypothetical protein
MELVAVGPVVELFDDGTGGSRAGSVFWGTR